MFDIESEIWALFDGPLESQWKSNLKRYFSRTDFWAKIFQLTLVLQNPLLRSRLSVFQQLITSADMINSIAFQMQIPGNNKVIK